MEINLLGWPSYFDHEGHLLDEYKLRKTAFFNGISNDVRFNTWPFLLNLWDRESSSINRHNINDRLLRQYESIRNGWINAVPELFDKEMKQSIKTIDKDVKRTDRNHPFFEDDDCQGLRMLRRVLITLSVYDPELAYVQGMNEIISPLLLTLQDEHLVFWVFVKLLPMLRDRLLTLDLAPQLSATAGLVQYMDEELYTHIEQLTAGHWIFCFRWYLLMFKNEFKMDEILRLWDVMFAQHNTSHFEIFVAASLLLMHKEQVCACSSSDQLLHFAQSVTSKLSVDRVICFARELTVKFANTEGLSENLKALIKQKNKVPPPLVGFVRRRQCFKNAFSGRTNMNDDFIRGLMGGKVTTTSQNTPLFFNCTEASVPVPSSNFLSGIQGATPVALAEKHELLPPPTSNNYEITPILPTKSRVTRPDALYKDSMSANPNMIIDEHSVHQTISHPLQFYEDAAGNHNYQGNQGNQGYHGNQGNQSYHGNQDYSHGIDAGNNGFPTHKEFDYNEETATVYEQGVYEQSYYNYHAAEDGGYNCTRTYNNHYYYNQQPVQESHNVNDIIYQDQVPPQGQYTNHCYNDSSLNQEDHGSLQPKSAVNSNSHLHTSQISQSNTGNVQCSRLNQLHENISSRKLDYSEETTKNENDSALNTINDDFWDMKISVHTDDALS